MVSKGSKGSKVKLVRKDQEAFVEKLVLRALKENTVIRVSRVGMV
jgi:hypothetical protein